MDIIAVREVNDTLEQLKKDGVQLYSISKADAISNCLYGAYLSYKTHSPTCPNVYSKLGSKVHDCLERILNNEATTDDLLPALQSELDEADMLGMDFPRDRRGGTSIRDNWIKNMTHFCTNFQKLDGEFLTEQLFIYPLSPTRTIRGYIDVVEIIDEDNKEISIWDWKTSSQFSKETLLEHGRQLVVYQIAKEHEGYKVKDVGWIMLKYAEISYNWYARKNAKNKTPITKVCDRWKIGETLKDFVSGWLAESGYDEFDIEYFVNKMLTSNSIDGLPILLQEEISINLYIRKYEVTEELKQEALDYITKQADIFESLPADDESKWAPSITPDKEFFCAYLCDHGKFCKHYKSYKTLKQLEKTADEDLF